MGQRNTKFNSCSVFGYGFVLDMNFDLEKFDKIKKCVNFYITKYNTNILIYENTCQFFEYKSDKIFICVPFIVSHNQEIIEGHELMDNDSVSINVNKDIRNVLKIVGDKLVNSNIINEYKLEWRLFECVRN